MKKLTLLILGIVVGFLGIRQIIPPKPVYCISHNPLGGPWTIERWWLEEEAWVAFARYDSRIAAEDVKAQLERGEIRLIDLQR